MQQLYVLQNLYVIIMFSLFKASKIRLSFSESSAFIFSANTISLIADFRTLLVSGHRGRVLAHNLILGNAVSPDRLAKGGWWERSVGLACG
jgi:hypothetical protein